MVKEGCGNGAPVGVENADQNQQAHAEAKWKMTNRTSTTATRPYAQLWCATSPGRAWTGLPVSTMARQACHAERYFTVNPASGTLEVFQSEKNPSFSQSDFRVVMVSDFAMMMRFLNKCEAEKKNKEHPEIAVDLEGVKLSRHGALCLIQACLRSDPTLVYLIDVHVLGRQGMQLETKSGLSFQKILTEADFLKLFFDPRNDVDALWHQFGIKPTHVFDLQIAELAERRSRGLQTRYVYGLFRCLKMLEGNPFDYDHDFARQIDAVAKSLFEPDCGGDYKIFQDRPLNPAILVYAAHDVRYMFGLFDYFMERLRKMDKEEEQKAKDQPNRKWDNTPWVNRVMLASAQRVN
eukprot:gene592-88_t